jgi:hypothetical protein
MTTVYDITSVNYSGDLRVDSLLHESVDWNYLLPYRTTLFYTFDLSVVDAAVPAVVTAFNLSQRAAAIEILNDTARVTGISFAQVASGASADIHFGAYDLAGGNVAGSTQATEQYAYGAGDVLTSYQAQAFVFLDNAEFAYLNTHLTAGSGGYEVLLHEIAHALGLGHPFDGLYRLPASLDNTDNTVMSYTSAGADKSTYQLYDLLALRWMYGEDGLRGSFGFNSTYGPSLSAQGLDQTFMGDSRDESFKGGAGNDTIDGGAGIDTAVYDGGFANFNLTKIKDGFYLTDNTGAEGTDKLTRVERLQFADLKLALDLGPGEHAGQAVEFIGLLAPQLVSSPSAVGSILGFFDQGASLHDVCQLALDVGLVQSIAGADTNVALAAMAFRNVMGGEADAPVLDMLLSYMDGRTASYSQAEFMTVAAELEVNQIHIGLMGLQQTGVEYVG